MTRKNLSALQLEIVIKETPLGSLATPGNVAKAVVWLASENSDGITGQFITVDNGWSSYRNV
jgi:NAD(P)-dependent dehydrogenase (short-subunit alcohol dehydrogenase family)